MNIQDIVNMSIENNNLIEMDIDLILKEYINNKKMTFKAYSVSIGNRDILFYTDKGTLTYVVDTYGHKNTFELFDYELD